MSLPGEAARGRFILYRGTVPTLRFTCTENGSIAGQTFRFTARETTDAPDPPALDAAGTPIDVGSISTPGIISVPLTRAQTLALSVRSYATSLVRTDTGFDEVKYEDVMTVKSNVRDAS